MYAFKNDDIDTKDPQNWTITYTLNCSGSPGNSRVIHFRQGLNGKYTLTDMYTAYYSNNPLYFTFEDKFSQFTVYSYTAGSNNTSKFRENGSTSRVPNNSQYYDKDLLVYHTRKSYPLDYFNDGVKDKPTIQVRYEEDLRYPVNQAPGGVAYNYTPTKPSQYANDSSVYFAGWFTSPTPTLTGDNPDKPFFDASNTNTKMPEGGLALYAVWAHRDVTVTFLLDDSADTPAALRETMTAPKNADGQWAFTMAWGSDLLDSNVADADGKYKAAFIPRKGDGTEYEFVRWYYTDENGAKKTYYPAMELRQNVAVTAEFKSTTPASAQVIVHYYVYDKDEPDHIKRDENGKPVNAPGLTDLTGVTGFVGDVYTAEAPIVNRYNPNYSRIPWTIRADTQEVDEDTGAPVFDNDGNPVMVCNNVITFLYKPLESWNYTIEYYLSYTSQAPMSWLPEVDKTAFENIKGSSFDILLSTTTGQAEGQYAPVTFALPTGWTEADGYTFDHFVYNGNEYNDVSVVIQKSSDATANVVKVYITPDESLIYPEGKYSVYDGTNQGRQTEFSGHVKPVKLPDETDIASINTLLESLTFAEDDTTSIRSIQSVKGDMYYVYYAVDNPDEPLSSVIDAGVYGARAYIVLEVKYTTGAGTATDEFLIWQSLDNEGDPTCHLFVDRRPVFLVSGDASVSEGTIARNNSVTWNVLPADDDIPDHLKTLVKSGVYGFVEKDLTDGQPAITYTFAADAFRSMKGSSQNVFSYTLPDNVAKNYNIFKVFGTLTVN